MHSYVSTLQTKLWILFLFEKVVFFAFDMPKNTIKFNLFYEDTKMKNENTNKKFSSKLYAACKYIIENIDEFKEFAIYEHVTSETLQEDNIISDLHNKLWAQYNFLIGERQSESKEAGPKGSEIMPKINVETLKTEILAKMLVITDNYANGEGKDGRKMNQHMFGVNIDKGFELINYLVEKILPDNIDALEQFRQILQSAIFYPKEKEYFRILELIYEDEKSLLLWNCGNGIDKEKVWERYNKKLDGYKKELIEKTDCEYTKGFFCKGKQPQYRQYEDFAGYPRYGKLEGIYNIWLYIDLCCNAIMQYVIQGIIKNTENKNKLESIMKLNNKILELIEAEKNIPYVECKGSPEEILFGVYSYYFIRDKYLQDIKNIKFTSDDIDTKKGVSSEYSLKNFYAERKKRTWNEIQDLFEFEIDKKSNIKTFKKNLANCYLLIEKLNRNGRNINITPIFLRALYRGIYMNKIMYEKKRKTSMTIMNDFLKTGNIETSEYWWISAILNKDFFKEHDLLEEYKAKNELQENLYHLVCIFLARLEPTDIERKFNTALHHINVIIDEIYDTCKNYYWKEERPNNRTATIVSPSDKWEITDEKYKEIYEYLESLLDISDEDVCLDVSI